MDKKINLKLRPSRYFFTLLSGLHLIIMFLACISNITVTFFIIIFITIIVSYYYLINKYIFRKNKYSIVALSQNDSSSDVNEWFLELYDTKTRSKSVESRLLPKGYVCNYFIILYFKIENKNKILAYLSTYKLLKNIRFKTIPVLLFPDMLDRLDYHRLKLYLTGY